MESRDIYSIKIIGEPFLDGESVFFTMKWIEADEYKNSIFVLRKGDKEPRRLTFGGKERSPIAGQDYMYYIKSSENSESVMVIRNSSEPQELLKLRSIEKFILHGKSLLVIGTEDAPVDKPFTATRLNYRFDGRGIIRVRKSLFIFGERLEKILDGDFDVTDVVSQDGRIWVVLTSYGNDAGLSDIYELDPTTHELRKITQGEGIINSILALPGGDVAYTGHREGIKPWAVRKLFPGIDRESVVLGKHTGNGSIISDLFLGARDRMFWDDGIYCCGQNGGKTSIYRFTDRKMKELVEGDFSIQDFHVNDGKIAYIYSSQEKPSVLVFQNIEYDPNPNFKGVKGVKVETGNVEGWVMKHGEDDPSILFVHGGPHMAYGESFMLEFQYFFNQGYNIFFCNPRGSAGYGEEFSAGCVSDWGNGPAEDIFNFIEKGKEITGIKGNFAITGGSYGGYMTNWMITNNNYFRAAISERCVSNLVSMCGTSDIGFWFNAAYMNITDPWKEDSILELMKASPIMKIKNATTPTMFIHGENDYRCPIEQAEQMFVGLKMNGVDTELVRYQGDGHEHARSGKPGNMIHRLDTKNAWFRKYMKV